jgi:hypothetical protein
MRTNRKQLLVLALLAVALPLAAGCSSKQATGSGGGTTSSTGSNATTGIGGSTSASTSSAGGFITTTTTDALLSNNDSGSLIFQDSYAPATRFNGGSTPVSNGDAVASKTPAASMTEGIVSKVPIKSLFPAGSTTKVLVETQAWFCTNGMASIPTSANADQCGSHIDIGYDSNAATHVKNEVLDMMSRGIDGALLDWSGQSAGLGAIDQHSTDTAAINTGNISLVMKEAEASGGKFVFSVMEDEGIKACASAAGCDVTTQLLSDLNFLATHFFPSSAYEKIGGRPTVYFFAEDTYASQNGKTIDWTTVRAQAQGNPLFIFENAGGFTHASADGAYAWVPATPIAQYPGSDPFGTTGFLPYFYSQAKSHTGLAIGSAYKGFDDAVVNGWGGGERYVGQQCGKTWLDTMGAAATYASMHPLEAVQIGTWDDYEEGTEIETGIDNWATVDASASGSILTWSVKPAANAPMDCTKALAGGFSLDATIHHYELYVASAAEPTKVVRVGADLPTSIQAYELGSLTVPPGSYVVYVYAVGQPSIRNHLSQAVAFTH